jgi:hypothetical protein
MAFRPPTSEPCRTGDRGSDMIRLLAYSGLAAAIVAIWFAGTELKQVLDGSTRSAELPGATPKPVSQNTPTPAPIQAWPTLFGEVIIVQPQPPAPVQPPAPQAPPIASLGYSLKGTVVLGGDTWAILSHPSGERILRVGDSLVDGAEVTDIDQQGLWLKTNRGKEIIAFEE